MFAELAGRPAAEVIERLELEPLPAEGGFWKAGPRTELLNSILYFMTPTGFSALHKLEVVEGWQWLAGDACRMLQLIPAGGEVEIELGPASVQTIVEPGVWQGCTTSGDWTLVSCWCSPAFTDAAFTLGARAELTKQYPQVASRIEELTR